jgi:hypothetical protein
MFHRNDRLYPMTSGSIPELISALSKRIYKVESQISSQPLAIIVDLKESIANHDRQLQNLRSRLSGLDTNLRKVGTDLNELKLGFPAPVSTPMNPLTPIPPVLVSNPTPVPPVSPQKSHNEVKFPLKEAKPLDGVISYLTRKLGGNVHDKGIVTITSKSVLDDPKYAARNVVDLTSDSAFCSQSEPGQWVCWDFRKMRARPTHYTVKCYSLKSWVVESSLDGKAWTEIDRKTDSEDFKAGWRTASFAVSKSAECRFIRLTQTGKRHSSCFDETPDCLGIRAIEFFGTLLKRRE